MMSSNNHSGNSVCLCQPDSENHNTTTTNMKVSSESTSDPATSDSVVLSPSICHTRRTSQCGDTMTDCQIPHVLTIRMLMSGKEVGSIIGKRGENVKSYREKSGARINISDGSCPERIVTVTGTVDQIYHAFAMICQKFEDDFIESLNKIDSDDDISCPPVTMRLLVPAIQCGSIIGKGGCKIKIIRELTGASVQVASEALPNSSERSVTVSGTARAVARCIKTVAEILVESPPRGVVVPYRSKQSSSVAVNGSNAMASPSMPTSPQVHPTGVLLPNVEANYYPHEAIRCMCVNSPTTTSAPWFPTFLHPLQRSLAAIDPRSYVGLESMQPWIPFCPTFQPLQQSLPPDQFQWKW